MSRTKKPVKPLSEEEKAEAHLKELSRVYRTNYPQIKEYSDDILNRNDNHGKEVFTFISLWCALKLDPRKLDIPLILCLTR